MFFNSPAERRGAHAHRSVEYTFQWKFSQKEKIGSHVILLWLMLAGDIFQYALGLMWIMFYSHMYVHSIFTWACSYMDLACPRHWYLWDHRLDIKYNKPKVIIVLLSFFSLWNFSSGKYIKKIFLTFCGRIKNKREAVTVLVTVSQYA